MYTVLRARRITFFPVNWVELQKLNQTAAPIRPSADKATEYSRIHHPSLCPPHMHILLIHQYRSDSAFGRQSYWIQSNTSSIIMTSSYTKVIRPARKIAYRFWKTILGFHRVDMKLDCPPPFPQIGCFCYFPVYGFATARVFNFCTFLRLVIWHWMNIFALLPNGNQSLF